MTAEKFLGKYWKSLFIVNYEERVSDQTPNQIVIFKLNLVSFARLKYHMQDSENQALNSKCYGMKINEMS